MTPYGLAECGWKVEAGEIELNVVVPPNATALVTLPGSDAAPIEVGSGSWHWRVPHGDTTDHESYTLDNLVGEIMADKAARAAVVRTLMQMNAPGFLIGILEGEKTLPFGQVLTMFPGSGELTGAITDALANVRVTEGNQ